MRGIFFDEDHARAVATRLVGDGYEAAVARERLAGEDDDEDHPWAVVSDAPEPVLEVLVDEYDGWLDADADADADAGTPPPPVVPFDLPAAPLRVSIHPGFDTPRVSIHLARSSRGTRPPRTAARHSTTEDSGGHSTNEGVDEPQ